MNKPTDFPPPLSPHRFTVDEVMRLVEAGVLVEGEDKVELIDGVLYEMSPEGPRHVRLASRIRQFFTIELHQRGLLRDGLAVMSGTLTLDERGFLEPDIAVVREPDGEHPVLPKDVRLVVEVAQTSIPRDLGPKRLAYAGAGVPELWVVDIKERLLHVLTEPREGDFGLHRKLREGETVAPSFAPDLVVSVEDLFR